MKTVFPNVRVELAVVVALGSMLFFAPLFRSGKVPLAILGLEWLAIFTLGLLVCFGALFERLRVQEQVLVSLAFLLPILQLVPLLGVSRLDLPGQADYHFVHIVSDAGLSVPFSLVPIETLKAVLVLLLPISVYLATRSLSTVSVQRLLVLLFAMAVFQAVLGLAQFGGGSESGLYLGMDRTHVGSAVGTYKSRNNFVGFMYLSLMVSLALFMATLGAQKGDSRQRSLRDRLVFLGSEEGHRAFIYGAISLLFLVAIVFSRSRAGIALTILGILLSSVAYARRIGGTNVYGLVGTSVSIVVAVAVAIGLGPVLARFSAHDPMEDGRWLIWESTINGISTFWPLGSGIGTFQEVFHRFQHLSQGNVFMNRAHNSYLEWLFTGGLPAALLITAMLLAYLLRWPRVWSQGTWGEFRYIQVAAGIGIGLMLLHELVDYNLFVPANMVYFAFFCGIFMRDYQEPVRAPRRKDPSKSPRPRTKGTGAQLQVIDGSPARNPFMDEEADAEPPPAAAVQAENDGTVELRPDRDRTPWDDP